MVRRFIRLLSLEAELLDNVEHDRTRFLPRNAVRLIARETRGGAFLYVRWPKFRGRGAGDLTVVRLDVDEGQCEIIADPLRRSPLFIPLEAGVYRIQLVDMRRRVHKDLRLRFGVDSQLLVAVFPEFDPLSPLSGSRAAGEPRIEVLWLGSSKAGEN